MTEEQKMIYEDFFHRFGAPSDTAEIRINHTFYKPDEIYNIDNLMRYDKWAAEEILRLQKAIEQVQIYRIAICERYNLLQFANVQKVVKLKREKHSYDNKVFYYLQFIDRYEDGHEEQTKSIKYAGADRRKAIADFEEFAKENKNYIAVKDIAKSYWEK